MTTDTSREAEAQDRLTHMVSALFSSGTRFMLRAGFVSANSNDEAIGRFIAKARSQDKMIANAGCDIELCLPLPEADAALLDRAENAEAELATLKAERGKLRGALLKYQVDLCEGYCGDASWEERAHAHPDFQRACGGCLAAAALLNAALGDA